MEPLQLKVLRRIPETKDAVTFELENTGPGPLHYEAGQFLTFLLQHHGQELRRSYSIGTAPGLDTHLTITIKKKENGEISRFLLDTLQPGDLLTSLPPAGRFTMPDLPEKNGTFLFIAAGSGIVPVFSLLRKVLKEAPAANTTLLYQNHDEENVIYHRQLQMLESQYPKFRRFDLLSHPINHRTPAQRLNNDLLEKLLTRLQIPVTDTLVFTCGPQALMRMVHFTLKLIGFREEQLRKENFTIDFIPAPAFTMDPAPRRVLIRTGGRHYQLRVAYPQTILQAALDNRIALPFSCKGGRCSACVARCLQGTVKMSLNEVLTEKDLREGLVLTCVGYAQTDVTLQF